MPRRNEKGEFELNADEEKQRQAALKDSNRWRKHESPPSRKPLTLDEIAEISRRDPHHGKGDEIELTEEDERALDKAWAKVAEEMRKKTLT